MEVPCLKSFVTKNGSLKLFHYGPYLTRYWEFTIGKGDFK